MAKEKKGGLDLTALDTVTACEDGADVEIVHPRTGEPIGLTITVVGSDSPTYRKMIHKLANKRAKRGRGILNSEGMEADNIELLAACSTAWAWVKGLMLGGEVPEFNLSNVRGIYRDYPWIREQVDVFIGDRANFLKN